jgi:flagellar M-ring protein FliF
LARTIVSGPHIAMARVHIASTGSNPFQRSVTPTASVSVTPNGSGLTAQQAKAIRFLVASAVAGLSADDVSVIDANGSLVGAVDEAAPATGADDKAQMLRERVERLLEARVGFGNAIVEVSVDTVTETEEIRERRFDPESRVAISTDTEERTSNSNEAGGGDVTVASNLPDGDAAGGADSASSQDSEIRERINYEVSETETAIIRAAGAIKRVTVAVLVNEAVTVSEEGEQISAPRATAEIDALRELVASAVGFDEGRGDIITIKSMALQSVAPMGTAASASLLDRFELDIMSAIQMAILAIVTLVLGLFVVRPLLSRNATEDPLVGAIPAIAPYDTGDVRALGADAGGSTGDLAGARGGDSPADLPALAHANDDGDAAPVSADPVDRLRAMIGERQEETVEILRSWLEESEERV